MTNKTKENFKIYKKEVIGGFLKLKEEINKEIDEDISKIETTKQKHELIKILYKIEKKYDDNSL